MCCKWCLVFPTAHTAANLFWNWLLLAERLHFVWSLWLTINYSFLTRATLKYFCMSCLEEHIGPVLASDEQGKRMHLQHLSDSWDIRLWYFFSSYGWPVMSKIVNWFPVISVILLWAWVRELMSKMKLDVYFTIKKIKN